MVYVSFFLNSLATFHFSNLLQQSPSFKQLGSSTYYSTCGVPRNVWDHKRSFDFGYLPGRERSVKSELTKFIPHDMKRVIWLMTKDSLLLFGLNNIAGVHCTQSILLQLSQGLESF